MKRKWTKKTVEALQCSVTPSGNWSFHIWKRNNPRRGEKCLCGQTKYRIKEGAK